MSSDNHPDVWEVQVRKAHGKYQHYSEGTHVGSAMGVYASINLADGESKRLLKNGRVIDRESGPSPLIRPVPGLVYEHGVVPLFKGVPPCQSDVIECADEDEAIHLGIEIRRNGTTRATPVRRHAHDPTWRDFNGKSLELITWR